MWDYWASFLAKDWVTLTEQYLEEKYERNTHRLIAGLVLQLNNCHWPEGLRTDLNTGQHVGGDDNTKGAKMGEATG